MKEEDDCGCPPIGPGKKYKDIYDFAINYPFDGKSHLERLRDYLDKAILAELDKEIKELYPNG